MHTRKAVIPLAGLGTRLLPLTKSVPKELLPIARKPVIHHVVEELAQAGIEQFLLITSKRNAAIEDYFSDDPFLAGKLTQSGKTELLTSIDFSHIKASFLYARQETAAGIADAVLLAEDFVDGEPFVLHMGDSIILHDQGLVRRMIGLVTSHAADGAIGIAQMPADEIKDHGTVIADGGGEEEYFPIRDELHPGTGELSGHTYGVTGRYVFSANIFDAIKETAENGSNTYDLVAAKRLLISHGAKIMAVKLKPEEKFCNAGDYATYFKTFLDFALEDAEYGDLLREFVGQHLSSRSLNDGSTPN